MRASLRCLIKPILCLPCSWRNVLCSVGSETILIKSMLPVCASYSSISIDVANQPDGSYVYAPATGSGSAAEPRGGNFIGVVNTATR